MDINYCIDYLELNANSYKLDQSNPPHKITYWDNANPDTQPTASELETAWTAITAMAYSEKRKTAYDELNQYELMYDDKVNSTDKWGEAITAIKNKFPKG